MEKYEVRITEEAISDLSKIYQYIAYTLKSPENALRQYRNISKEILSLETLPERHPLFVSEPERTRGIRTMAVGHYLVFYIVDPGIVTVTDILYGASNVQERLKTRHR